MSKFKETLKLIIYKVTRFFVFDLPPLLFVCVGIYYVFTLLISLSKDTTDITNASFAILATFASLSFSCSRAIEGSEDKDKLAYAGERFFHSSVLCLIASVLKYVSLSLDNQTSTSIQILKFVISAPVGILFYYALYSSHGGLLVINKFLWVRLNRHPEWDNMF
jgi:hypothetical protein